MEVPRFDLLENIADDIPQFLKLSKLCETSPKLEILVKRHNETEYQNDIVQDLFDELRDKMSDAVESKIPENLNKTRFGDRIEKMLNEWDRDHKMSEYNDKNDLRIHNVVLTERENFTTVTGHWIDVEDFYGFAGFAEIFNFDWNRSADEIEGEIGYRALTGSFALTFSGNVVNGILIQDCSYDMMEVNETLVLTGHL